MATWAEIVAKLKLDGSDFQAGLKKAADETQKFANIARNIAGGFAGAAIAQQVHHIVELASRFNDLSEQYNVSTDAVQQLDAAAAKSGQTFEDIGAALLRFRTARIEAVQGNEELRRSFERVGISLGDLTNSNLSDLELILLHTAQIAKDPALQEFFGKSGGKLATVFSELEDTQITPISEDDLKAIEDASRSLAGLRREAEGFAAGRIAEFLRTGPLAITPASIMAEFAQREGDAMFPNRTHARSAEWVGPMPLGKPIATDRKTQEMALKAEEALQERLNKLRLDGLTIEQKRAELLRQAQEKLNAANILAKKGKEVESLQALGEFVQSMQALGGAFGEGPGRSIGLGSRQAIGAGVTLGAGVLGDRQNKNALIAENTRKTFEAVKEVKDAIKQNRSAGGGPFGSS